MQVHWAARRRVLPIMPTPPHPTHPPHTHTHTPACPCRTASGLLYASQSFAFIRRNFLWGLILVFAPLLALEAAALRGLWAIWLAKAGFNAWRLAGAAWVIHRDFLRRL